MIDWNVVEEAVEDAQGIAFDTCHKIYVLMDTEQVALMREYEYDLIHTAEEMSSGEMLETLKKWFDESCPLRFIEATETLENTETGFTTLIEQGATDHEECEDCNDPTCKGVCYNDTEDEDEDEDEDEEDEE